MQNVCYTVLSSLARGGSIQSTFPMAVVSGVQQAAAARHGVAGDTPSNREPGPSWHLFEYIDILASIVPSTYLSILASSSGSVSRYLSRYRTAHCCSPSLIKLTPAAAMEGWCWWLAPGWPR